MKQLFLMQVLLITIILSLSNTEADGNNVILKNATIAVPVK